MEKVIEQRTAGYSVGFGADIADKDAKKVGELLADLQPNDLLKYGLIPEFIGRLPVVVALNDLDETALIRILTEPKNALVKQYQALFKMEGVQLTFTPKAYKAIAKKAIDRGTGARGLRSIMETLLLDLMYELPGKKDLSEVIIDEKVVAGDAEPTFVFENKEKTAV